MESSNAERDRLIAKAVMNGSDDLPTFGGQYVGGYFLQQNPEELADAVLEIREWAQGVKLSSFLEIGSAAGGFARFLWDEFHFETVVIVDDNKHPRAGNRKNILQPIALEANLIEFIGDSTSPECYRSLDDLDVCFDIVMVDAGHNYENVKKDFATAADFVKFGGLILMHDIAAPACPGVRQAWEEIPAVFRRVFTVTASKPPILGIGAVEAPR
jgi:predicted O-methyltransferase YrrM